MSSVMTMTCRGATSDTGSSSSKETDVAPALAGAAGEDEGPIVQVGSMSADGPAHPRVAAMTRSEIGTSRVEAIEPINSYIGAWLEEYSDPRRLPVSRRRAAIVPRGDDPTLGSFRNWLHHPAAVDTSTSTVSGRGVG